jgi:hypothetical protein
MCLWGALEGLGVLLGGSGGLVAAKFVVLKIVLYGAM